MAEGFARWLDRAETELAAQAETSARPTGWVLHVGSQALFTAMRQAFEQAQHRIWVETYILDPNGQVPELMQALNDAAQRGVEVRLLTDGFGTPQVPDEWPRQWAQSGVQWRTYKPLGPGGLWFPSRWRRLHRKLCVVDDHVAFCGGINWLDDHHDPIHWVQLAQPRFDAAVQITGPLVDKVAQVMNEVWWRLDVSSRLRQREVSAAWAAIRLRDWRSLWRQRPPQGLRTLVLRDNVSHRSDIVRAYLAAIGRARQEVWLANAFFMPAKRVQRALCVAAARGVKVRLVVQGHFEYALPYRATRHLYAPLLAAGVEIWEYHASYLHAKVAVVDERWATVGSSNLDPLSLLLAREANVVSRHPDDVRQVRQALAQAVLSGAKPIDQQALAQRRLWDRALDALTWWGVRLAVWVTARSY